MAKKKAASEQKYEKILAPSEQDIDRDVLPQNVIKIGEQVLHDKNIYILQSVYKEIHEFTKDKLTVESGGILMGYTVKANGKINIIIDGFIEGKHSEGTPTTLKFTHETWDYVHKEAERNFPDDKIIGWIHTHPNFGIFLSNYDKFIHQNFFNDENQIAYVVDPIQHIEGFFFWVNGQIEKCPGYYIYDEIGTEIEPPEEITGADNPTQGKASEPTKKIDLKPIYLAFGGLAALSLLGFIITTSRISELHQSINSLNEQLLTQNQSIASNVQTVDQELISMKDQIGKHTVVFLADDTVLSSNTYSTGEKIILPTDIPAKESDEMYDYTFAGWDKEADYVASDAVYKAVFNESLREYTIKFEDENGEVISEKKYHYGDQVEIPDYISDNIPDDGKEYETAWDNEVTDVTADMTYKAVIKEVTADNENNDNSEENAEQNGDVNTSSENTDESGNNDTINETSENE